MSRLAVRCAEGTLSSKMGAFMSRNGFARRGALRCLKLKCKKNWKRNKIFRY